MIALSRTELTSLQTWFTPDRPGPQIGWHVIQTGHGHAWADRWPNPRAVLVETAGNYSLAGDPGALTPESLRPHITGFVDAPDTFAPLLRNTFPDLVVWDRIIFELHGEPQFFAPSGFVFRRLEASDTHHLTHLTPESNWIAKTWGGPANLAASGYAWGAFCKRRLASVANTFFVGKRYEDIGVVTEPEFRGLGLSVACAGALCSDILRRGHVPSWTTSLDNVASIHAAEKLGVSLQRRDVLYVVGILVPRPPSS